MIILYTNTLKKLIIERVIIMVINFLDKYPIPTVCFRI
jgi:hypothetical protein